MLSKVIKKKDDKQRTSHANRYFKDEPQVPDLKSNKESLEGDESDKESLEGDESEKESRAIPKE